MIITDIFDAAGDGTFQDFEKFYNGDPNQVSKTRDINLLSMAMINDKNPNDKLKIIKFLLSKGVDVGYATRKSKRNALHLFNFCVLRPTVEYELEVTRLLIDGGVDINARDKYGAIPLKYAITINKLPTESNEELYKLLLEKGSNYREKDVFGKSCVDYATEYSWRTGFLDIVKEYEHGNQ